MVCSAQRVGDLQPRGDLLFIFEQVVSNCTEGINKKFGSVSQICNVCCSRAAEGRDIQGKSEAAFRYI